jgi:23S rRNA (guanosine2251-2'-O)-methyltransferase
MRAPDARGDVRHGGAPADGRTSATCAYVEEAPGISLEELFAASPDESEGLWIALDCLQDPHNVGAIFRTAAFFGVRGILLTQERSAPMSSTVYDVASGGVEHVPFTLQTNLQRAFEVAKDAGLWILGTSEHSQESFADIKRDRKWLLVLGNEEKGMRRLTEERCDVLCGIPPRGQVTSLNVSVAAGVLISRLA